MMTMVDTHCHIHDEAFDADRGEVLARAAAAGVARVLAMGEGPADNMQVLLAAASHPEILPCLGLHPDQVAGERVAGAEDPALLAERLGNEVEAQVRRYSLDLLALGEVGLDYWLAKEPAERQAQRQVLRRMVALSSEMGLPLSVHSRSAGHHTVDLLLEAGATPGLEVLHAFDGAAKHAARGAEAGFHFSVPPSVKRSPQKQKLVRRLPLESLLLETDAPVLAPQPGARNEPANAVLAAQAVAELKGVSVEEVARVTTKNAQRVFGVKLSSRLAGIPPTSETS